MKNKSNKLRKLENNRYSILTDDLKKCYICKRPKQDLHEIYGGCNRKVSMANGFVIPICRSCHFKVTNDNEFALFLKKFCQEKFERLNTRQDFMRLIGKNYLE
jgi:hypothetical protein